MKECTCLCHEKGNPKDKPCGVCHYKHIERNNMKTKKDLKPINAVIQVCPECRKVDVYLNDGHICDAEWQAERQLNDEYYD